MGIFFEQIEVVNRDNIQRSVTFDGQRIYLQPNYDEAGTFLEDVHNFIPKTCWEYAYNQNVVMGTEDARDPSDFDSYVVAKVKKRVKGRETKDWKFDFSYLPSSENTAITPVKLEEYLDDEHLKVVNGRGKFKAAEARVAAGGRGIARQHIDE